MRKEIILVDLEGTLSDSRHRGIYTKDNHYYWHKEFSKDPTNDIIFNILYGLITTFPYDWAIVSSKPIDYQMLIEDWIKTNISSHFTNRLVDIMLRPLGDFRTSPRLKEAMLQNLINRGYNPVLAIDDREDVCAMYRRHGLETLHYKNTL